LAYCKETISDARRSGIRLAEKIKECENWQVVCVDPEHVLDEEWREITDWPIYRQNIRFGCVDEAHLIDEWGLDFLIPFKHIGNFLRGRLPSKIAIVALSATVQPGSPTTSVCERLGMLEGSFHLIRRSNERPNTQFSIQVAKESLSGNTFPDLLPFLAASRKTIIHCQTLDDVFRVFTYLWRHLPPGSNKLRKLRMYHALFDPEYNAETIRLMEEDYALQIIIGTIAIANGINARKLLDNISLKFAKTANTMWQEKGRVGRDSDTVARGIILVSQSEITMAEKQLAGTNTYSLLTNDSEVAFRRCMRWFGSRLWELSLANVPISRCTWVPTRRVAHVDKDGRA
jgi:superfamily II DNA helicase RecQ